VDRADERATRSPDQSHEPPSAGPAPANSPPPASPTRKRKRRLNVSFESSRLTALSFIDRHAMGILELDLNTAHGKGGTCEPAA
jgi:hypothetical protein